MTRTERTRTIRCAYCGAERSFPSRRGPAPRYCSAAHRQAHYRQHLLDEERRPGMPLPPVSLRSEVEALRQLLEHLSTAPTWPQARRVLAEGLLPTRESRGD